MATRVFIPPVDFMERLAIEGDSLSIIGQNASTSVATGAVNTIIASSSFPQMIGKCAVITTVTAGANAAGIGQIGLAGDSSSRFAGYAHQIMFGTNGGTIVIPITPLIIRGFQFLNGGVNLSIRNNLTAGSVTYASSVSAAALLITDDLNFNARHTLGFFGDSTLNGTGPTATSKMWPFIVRDWLITQGYDCRVMLKSRSGSTSIDHELWRAAGWHSSICGSYSMGFYNLGLNDAANGVSSATVVANLTAFWTWWDKKYPNAPLVVVGPTPLENNTSETNAVAIRSAISAYITGVNSDRLKFVDTTALWDRTLPANYAATDTPGSRVHYVDGPNALVAGAITTMLTSNPSVRPE